MPIFFFFYFLGLGRRRWEQVEAVRNVRLLGAEDRGDAAVALHERSEDAAQARVLLPRLLQLHREGDVLLLVGGVLALQLLLVQQPLRLLLLQRSDGGGERLRT